MKIVLDSLVEGARRASGTVVIVDVYRCFTTAAVAFSRGAARIVMVAEPDEALALRREGVGELCVGEVGGKRPPGFDFGNSPSELSSADLRGKTLIQSTTAGTVGVAAARLADHVYGGSLTVADATARAVLRRGPELVTIVAMGSGAKVRSDEDEQCALYLRNLLLGRWPDRDAVRKLVLVGQESQKYGDLATPHFPAADREMALEIDALPFAIGIAREGTLLVATPERV